MLHPYAPTSPLYSSVLRRLYQINLSSTLETLSHLLSRLQTISQSRHGQKELQLLQRDQYLQTHAKRKTSRTEDSISTSREAAAVFHPHVCTFIDTASSLTDTLTPSVTEIGEQLPAFLPQPTSKVTQEAHQESIEFAKFQAFSVASA
jgi:hypothetical protein